MLKDDAQINRLVGQRVISLRKFNGISRAQLGDSIGLGEQQVGRIERGESSLSAIQIIKLSEVLKVRPSELIDVNASLTSDELKYLDKFVLVQKDNFKNIPINYLSELIKSIIDKRS